uniref:hypothetical protein n=1 Tax=Parasutterella excrementihominis TaxID=487175 RepID=UPI003AB26023
WVASAATIAASTAISSPRFHVKYNPNEYVHFRLSAGKGYRTNHVLAENNYLLASSRRIDIDRSKFPKAQKAASDKEKADK